MTQENQSYTEGLAQITTEEGQLAYGIQRYVLGFIAGALWIAFFTYTFTDATLGMKFGDRVPSPGVIAGFAFLSVMFSLGSWWANRIHQKLTALKENLQTD